jgi:hypothetical protein
VTFDKGSAGTVSTLFYEFKDFGDVGKLSKEHDVFGFPVSTTLLSYGCDGASTQAFLSLSLFIRSRPISVLHKPSWTASVLKLLWAISLFRTALQDQVPSIRSGSIWEAVTT